ncbi:MAG: hypothetical protein JO166_00600, partial [Deltaproteobacteria bacterium]|nr:hypothetical protein [Deltaproteobacteria bacterium]
MPEFPEGAADDKSDFNDLLEIAGEDVVCEQLDAGLEAAIDEIIRPVFDVTEPDIPKLTTEIERTLLIKAEQLRLFERNGEVVRVVYLDGEAARQLQKHDHVVRSPGATVLRVVSVVQLREYIERYVRFT